MTQQLSPFEVQGYTVLERTLDDSTCDTLVQQLRQQLQVFADGHREALNNYLRVVNRWPLSSLVDNTTYLDITKTVQARTHKATRQVYEIFEADVLYKSPIAALATPCHQDIGYAWHKPYAASTWLRLTPAIPGASPLQVLPRSHTSAILSAVDFWSPDYVDHMENSVLWQRNHTTPKVAQGDALLFSSRLWHRSTPHNASQDRLALVLRWGNKDSASIPISPPPKATFGLWNCGQETLRILQQAWYALHHETLEDVEQLCSSWLRLAQADALPIPHEADSVAQALRDVILLHNASTRYGGGDNQGTVYKRLWTLLLQPLQELC